MPKRSFLGFQKMEWPSCKTTVTYPLTNGYRITYLVIFAIMVLSIIGSYSRGEIGFPGGLGIAVLIALFLDWKIKKRIKSISAAVPSQT